MSFRISPWYETLQAWGKAGSAEAAKKARALEEAHLARERMVETFRRAQVVVADTHEDGKVAPRILRTAHGSLEALIDVQARPLRADWSMEPKGIARKLERCSTSWGVHRRADRTHGSHPIRCDQPFCPRCASSKSGARANRYEAMIEGLIQALDCDAYSVTLTVQHLHKPGRGPNPVVLLGSELGRYTAEHVAQAGELGGETNGITHRVRGSAVPGESLLEMRGRVSSIFRQLRNRDTEASAWWGANVLGYVFGYDVTGSVQGKSGKRLVRWHSHLHALVLVRKPKNKRTQRKRARRARAQKQLEGPERRRADFEKHLRKHWVRLGGGPELTVNVVAGTEERPLGRALAEVLKYPCKVGELTHAQLLEFVAATKGTKAHQPGGCLHSSHAAQKVLKRARELEPELGAVEAVDQARAELKADKIDASAALAMLNAELERQEERTSAVLIRREIKRHDPAVGVQSEVELRYDDDLGEHRPWNWVKRAPALGWRLVGGLWYAPLRAEWVRHEGTPHDLLELAELRDGEPELYTMNRRELDRELRRPPWQKMAPEKDADEYDEAPRYRTGPVDHQAAAAAAAQLRQLARRLQHETERTEHPVQR